MDYHIWMLYEALSNHYECEMVLKEQATLINFIVIKFVFITLKTATLLKVASV